MNVNSVSRLVECESPMGMTSYGILETAASVYTHQQHSVKADASDEKWGVSGKHRHYHKVSNTSFTAAFTAVVLASLVSVYLLFICYQHLSHSHVREAPRILASNFPDEEENECLDSPGDDDGDEQLAGQLPPALPDQWTLPPMPDDMLNIMAGALRMLAEPAAQCRLLAPHLNRSQLVSLVYPVTAIAALELSGFALLPPELQPLRKWVSAEYLELNSSLLGISPEGKGRENISLLLLLTKRLGEEPKTRLTSDPWVYEKVMVCQYRLFQLANANVLKVLSELVSWVSPERRMISRARVKRAARTLEAIYAVRCRQILSNFFTRYWINTRQKRTKKFFFYNLSMLKTLVSSHLGTLAYESRQITDAIKSAGGEPLLLFLPVPDDTEETGGQEQQHASRSGGKIGIQKDADYASLQDIKETGEIGASSASGVSQGKSSVLSQLFFGSKEKLTKTDLSTGIAGSDVGSYLTEESYEERQASPHHISSNVRAREAFNAASASASELVSTSGQMGGIGEDEDEDEDVLHFIEQALDWNKAFAEEAGER